MQVGRESALVCIYSSSKTGKTTDTIFSFPNGVFAAAPGALKPSLGIVGVQLSEHQVRKSETVLECKQLIERLPSGTNALVIDDFSLICENTIARISKWPYNVLQSQIVELRNVARSAGCHVVFTCHMVEAEVKDGQFLRGGPKMPSHKMSEMLPAICDLVLRGEIVGDRLGWKAVYRSGLDPNWVTGDRHGVCPDPAPMNVGEILRAAGYKLARTLAWQEDAVQKIAVAMAKRPMALWGQAVPELISALRRFTTNPLHIRWTLRDGLDRAELMIAKTKVFAGYGVDV